MGYCYKYKKATTENNAVCKAKNPVRPIDLFEAEEISKYYVVEFAIPRGFIFKNPRGKLRHK